MSVSDTDLVAILHDLYMHYVVLDIKPGEFTIRMFSKQHDLTWNRANKAIKRAVSAGAVRPVGKRREVDGVISEAYVMSDNAITSDKPTRAHR